MMYPAILSERTKDVKGDVMECGVLAGMTFIPLAEANPHKICHAVDPFIGFRKENHKLDDQSTYPPGRFTQYGSGTFRKQVAHLDNVKIYEGYAPDILDSVQLTDGLSFVHLDMDLYSPTIGSIKWCWERLNVGGIIIGHDWHQGRINAGAAMREFSELIGQEPNIKLSPPKYSWAQWAWWQKA